MDVRPGYKLTEIGLIPEDWHVKTLGEIYAFRNGINAEKGAYGYGLPFVNVLEPITYSHLYGPEIPGLVSLPKLIVDQYALQYGDVLFNRTSEVQDEVGLAATYLGSDRVLFGGFVIRGRPIVQILDPTYSGYALRSSVVRSQIIPMGQGGIRANVSQQNLASALLPIPTLAEQRTIANALNEADALIESLVELIAKKRAVKLGAMQELLTGKRRLPGFNEHWQRRRLGEIAPLQRGFDLPTSQLQPGPYPVVYSNGVLNRHISYQVRGPGVVTGRSGTIGRVAFITKDFWPHNTALWVTSFRGNDPKFIFYLYTHIGLEQFAAGSGVPTLNRNDVHNFRVSIPPMKAEQEAIATVLSDMDAEVDALEQKLVKARQIKQGMMQDLLTGRTRLV